MITARKMSLKVLETLELNIEGRTDFKIRLGNRWKTELRRQIKKVSDDAGRIYGDFLLMGLVL